MAFEKEDRFDALRRAYPYPAPKETTVKSVPDYYLPEWEEERCRQCSHARKFHLLSSRPDELSYQELCSECGCERFIKAQADK